MKHDGREPADSAVRDNTLCEQLGIRTWILVVSDNLEVLQGRKGPKFTRDDGRYSRCSQLPKTSISQAAHTRKRRRTRL